MSGFYRPESVEVPGINQQVYINGYRRTDVIATDVQQSCGTSGSTCNMMTNVDWDNKDQFRGATVRVLAGSGGALSSVFWGWISERPGNARDRICSLSAQSPMVVAADDVFVGQGMPEDVRDLRAIYPRYAMRNGIMVKTGWKASEILRDLFSSAAQRSWRGGGGCLPSSWRTLIDLGPLHYLDVDIGDIYWEGYTLRSALEEILQKIPTVQMREMPSSSGVRLEFFRLNELTGNAVKRIVVARTGEGCGVSNVADITATVTSDGLKTRVLAYGAPRQVVCSLFSTNPNATEEDPVPDPDWTLQPWWNPALESAVLANPALSTQQGAGYEAVFRRFRLPAGILKYGRYFVDKTGIPMAEGAVIPPGEQSEVSAGSASEAKICAFKIVRELTWVDGVGRVIREGATFGPVEIQSVEWNLKDGWFTLGEPAIEEVSQVVDASNAVIETYGPAQIVITMALQGERISYDSGSPSQNSNMFSPIGRDGRTVRIMSDNYKRISFGLDKLPTTVLYDGSGMTVITDPSDYVNDLALLRDRAADVLREANREKTTYNITVPWFSAQYVLGDMCNIVGVDDFEYGKHQILSISHVLTQDHRTTLSTDNTPPLIANEVFNNG